MRILEGLEYELWGKNANIDRVDIHPSSSFSSTTSSGPTLAPIHPPFPRPPGMVAQHGPPGIPPGMPMDGVIQPLPQMQHHPS